MKVAFHTLGCKVNSYETQAIAEQFLSRGFTTADFSEPADVYVINSCSVTSMGEHKSRQFINRARKLNPSAVIVATGCYAQRSPEELEKLADIVVGNNHKSEICQLTMEMLNSRRLVVKCCKQAGDQPLCQSMNQPSPQAQGSAGRKERFSETEEPTDARTVWDDLTHCRDFESQNITFLGENVRAYVKIQDGCNRFCSYCIIPYLRGRSRNRNELEILTEVRTLAANGYKEVVLTGIDISTYSDLAGLIEKVAAISGIERIRLGSLEVSAITEDFISRCAAVSKFCPQFHLSLQSGSATVLKRMNRHYTPDEYEAAVKRIRNAYGKNATASVESVGEGRTIEAIECVGEDSNDARRFSITTDIIVGFPGETDEEFEETVDFVRKIDFTQIHVFKYSRRKGTVADKMSNQIPEQIKNRRSEKLIALGAELKAMHEANLIGKEVSVLIEDEAGGFTPEYIRIKAAGSPGEIVKVKVGRENLT